MQITEEKLDQIENDLIRFFRHVALPRYMKEVRTGLKKGTYGEGPDEIAESVVNDSNFFTKEFIEWLFEANNEGDFITYPDQIKNGTGN